MCLWGSQRHGRAWPHGSAGHAAMSSVAAFHSRTSRALASCSQLPARLSRPACHMQRFAAPGAAPTATTSATRMSTARMRAASTAVSGSQPGCPALALNGRSARALTRLACCLAHAGTVYPETGSKQVCCAAGTTPYTNRWGIPKCCPAGKALLPSSSTETRPLVSATCGLACACVVCPDNRSPYALAHCRNLERWPVLQLGAM